MIQKISAIQSMPHFLPKTIHTISSKKKQELPKGEKTFAEVLNEIREKQRGIK